ncbi:MAG: hypothetical protein L0Y72_04190 [Gemmataceae bacterium]|nr:hypothetical protein [Gemmataceae bacterium]
MQHLDADVLGQACRLFLTLAYPHGPESIPHKKRAFWDLCDKPLAGILPPTEGAAGVCRELRNVNGTSCGYEFRLGSYCFPHLKLRVQEVEHDGQPTWVYMVDTHDAFSKCNRFPPPDHPDAAAWLELQQSNRCLKEQIEAAFEEQGITTVNALLRGALKA